MISHVNSSYFLSIVEDPECSTFSAAMTSMAVSSEEESSDEGENPVNQHRKHIVYQSILAELISKVCLSAL